MDSASEKTIPLTQMESGQSGVVAGIAGGLGVIRRLENLGIIPGRKIVKVGAMFMRGPVTVRVGQTQAGIGYGMASKIMVELRK